MYGGLGLILWGIFVPRVSCGPLNAKSAKARAQLSGYSKALQAFYNEYGEFPNIFRETGSVNLADGLNAERFVIVLSGRDVDGSRNIEAVQQQGNRKCIPFYSFGSSEWHTPEGWSQPTITDAYGNPNIVVVVDLDNDGKITMPIDGKAAEVKTRVGIYTITDNLKEFVSTCQ